MSVKIRLSRIGKKHVPFHRLVVVDSRKKRDGASLDNIGTYDAQRSQVVTFNEELYNEWLKKGAQPSDSARKIYKQFKSIGLDALAKVSKEKTQPKSEPAKVTVQEVEVSEETSKSEETK